jgi:hypothetical protein
MRRRCGNAISPIAAELKTDRWFATKVAHDAFKAGEAVNVCVSGVGCDDQLGGAARREVGGGKKREACGGLK